MQKIARLKKKGGKNDDEDDGGHGDGDRVDGDDGDDDDGMIPDICSRLCDETYMVAENHRLALRLSGNVRP